MCTCVCVCVVSGVCECVVCVVCVVCVCVWVVCVCGVCVCGVCVCLHSVSGVGVWRGCGRMEVCGVCACVCWGGAPGSTPAQVRLGVFTLVMRGWAASGVLTPASKFNMTPNGAF